MIDAGGQSEIVLVRDLLTELVGIDQDTERMETDHFFDIPGREDSVVE